MNYPIDGAGRPRCNGLTSARLLPAAERGGLFVFLGVEAGDALLERRELDDDEAVESLRAFERLIAPAASEHLRAVLREDRGHAVGVLLVFHRIVDFGAGYPVGGHGFSLSEEVQDFARMGDHRFRIPGGRIAALAVIAPAGGDEAHAGG